MNPDQILDEKTALMRILIDANGREVPVSSTRLAQEMAECGPRGDPSLRLRTKAGIFLALLEKNGDLPGFRIRELDGRIFRLGFKKVDE